MKRRDFLAGLAAAGAVVGVVGCSSDDDQSGAGSTTSPTTAPGADLPVPDLASDPFTLGVASGDPLPGAVVLWTLLVAAEGDDLPAQVPVRWQVAADEAFGEVVSESTAVADATQGHSVHVDATGLDPATTYWYRFQIGDRTSPVGRTRTAPTADADPGELRLAVTSCQAWQSGYYTPYREIAAADLDAVVFLGDWIYELESSTEVRPHGMEVPVTLDEYRAYYALNGSDPDLLAARAAHPWIVTWDDHEVEDNYADGEPGELGREAAEQIEGGFAAKKAAAYQAWWEYQPVRTGPPEDGSLEIHRDLEFGTLATGIVLDTRQYRTPQPRGEGLGNLPRAFGGGPQLEGAFDADAQMLGERQEEWLLDLLAEQRARWTLVFQQSVIAEVNRRPDQPEGGYSMDAWDGYVVPRQRILDHIADEELADVVFLGGDIHTSAVLDVRQDPKDPSSPLLAPELIAPSLSAVELLSPEAASGARANEHIHLYDIEHRGWLDLRLTDESIDATFRYADTTVPDAPFEEGTRWRIESGNPQIAQEG